MNCAFPIPGSITALASSTPGELRRAELSIVSILDGEIGDPVTWIDEPEGGMADLPSVREARAFEAVAEDIGAHLPVGAVLVHRPDSALTLLQQVLPAWRPTLVVDMLGLAEYPQMSANRRHGTRDVTAAPEVEVGHGATAERAVAIARLLVRFLGPPENCPGTSYLMQDLPLYLRCVSYMEPDLTSAACSI